MPDLKRKILDASTDLVAEKGVRGVSFREVARRAGVSHQAPYHEFGDHLGIMRAIAREGFAKLTEMMTQAATQSGPDALDALSAAGIAYIRFARDHLGNFRVMFERSLVDLHEPSEPMPEAEQTYSTLMSLAEAARVAGYGRGLSGEAIAHLCWSSVHGAAILLVEGVLVSKSEVPARDPSKVAEAVVQSMRRLLENRE